MLDENAIRVVNAAASKSIKHWAFPHPYMYISRSI
jgi:hypothetical protein